MSVVNQYLKIFPSSISTDTNRLLSEENISGILGSIASNKFLISGFNLNSITGSQISIGPGKAIINGYQVETLVDVTVPLTGYKTYSGATGSTTLYSDGTNDTYLCLRIKITNSSYTDSTVRFVDYDQFKDMPTANVDCPFVIKPILNSSTSEDIIADDTSIESGYTYIYVPIYKLRVTASSSGSTFSLVTTYDEDIRQKTFTEPLNISSGYKGDTLSSYFGEGLNSDTTQQENNWKQALVISNGGTLDNLQNVLYEYINFIHTHLRGYPSFDTISHDTTPYVDKWDVVNINELPLYSASGDCIINRLKNSSFTTTSKFINDNILIDTTSAPTYESKLPGKIVTLDINSLVNQVLLPKASTTIKGILSVSTAYIPDTVSTTGLSSTNILNITNSILSSSAARYSFRRVSVAADSYADARFNEDRLNLRGGTNISLALTSDTNGCPVITANLSGTVATAYALRYGDDTSSTGPYYINQTLLKTSDVEFNKVKVPTIETAGLTITTNTLAVNNANSNVNFSISGSLTVTSNITAQGNITANKVYQAVYNDYAEYFKKANIDETFEDGDIIAKLPGVLKYTKATEDNKKLVVGACSYNFGHILGGEKLEDMSKNNERFIPVAISGRVMVKILGPIMEGDLITISYIPGVGIKSNDKIPGTIIGKALENKIDVGIDKILMLVALN